MLKKTKHDNRKQEITKDIKKTGSLKDKNPYYDPDLRITVYAESKEKADSFIELLKSDAHIR